MSRMSVPSLLSLSLLLLAGPASAAGVVRVPQDARTLDAAIDKVGDGGVIEMAAGSYASPPNGFQIANERKGFTVRAAAGAAVAIEGGGLRPLVRFVNSDRGRGKRVVFERIVFRNGHSEDGNVAGGVTVVAADALFRDCSFRGNTSPKRAGALLVRSAAVAIEGGDLTGNRVNLAGHSPSSAGGAILVIDGALTVSGVRFEGNQAGWVGGAIYAIGGWDGAGSNISVNRSTFVGNQAVADPCCEATEPTTGGALHAEDLTTLRVHDSLFEGNRADTGGAVDAYRSDVEIHGSAFRGNFTASGGPGTGAGGAVSAFSSDFADGSTGFGAIDRRPVRLVISHTLLQGAGDPARASSVGGCVLASGDAARLYGSATAPPAGTPAENRARVEVRETVFSDCDVRTGPGGTGGLGGALSGDLIDLVMEDSMVLDSDARGANAGGGGIALRQESNARILRTTFAHDTAERWGGALFVGGSTVLVDASRFFGNDVMPGSYETLTESRGAAIYTIPLQDPTRPRGVGGLVSSSAFADNLGIAIWDVQPVNGPANSMRYENNLFQPESFGEKVYVHTQASPGGASPSELNDLSGGGNQRVYGLRDAAMRAVPSPNAAGVGGASRTASFLGYAWTGFSAAIGTFPLSQRAGVVEVPAGDYTLAVDGTPAAALRGVGSCTGGPYLCVASNRFVAEVTWKGGAARLPAQAVALSGDTGYFWFVDPANVELVVKVLDARPVNGHFWVFYGGLTNLEYSLKVTDTLTGAVKVYNNPAGKFASAGDTTAFPSAGKAAPAPTTAPIAANWTESATCAARPGSLCLGGSRFQVDLAWKDFAGKSGAGQAVALTGDTGYFWFSSPGNVEVIVKVLDGRGLNGHFWVFYGALTNLEYSLTVTDTLTGKTKAYTNPPKKFGSQGDTVAIPAAL
ncbi:MAG: hypothetical protein ACJ75H_19495 [Thermoanaerobaculia bacterium]